MKILLLVNIIGVFSRSSVIQVLTRTLDQIVFLISYLEVPLSQSLHESERTGTVLLLFSSWNQRLEHFIRKRLNLIKSFFFFSLSSSLPIHGLSQSLLGFILQIDSFLILWKMADVSGDPSREGYFDCLFVSFRIPGKTLGGFLFGHLTVVREFQFWIKWNQGSMSCYLWRSMRKLPSEIKITAH